MLHPQRVSRWFAVAFAFAAWVGAQDVIVPPPGAPWIVQTWNTASGLPQNTVRTVLQAGDGMVWVATYGGLCRGDGIEWHVHAAEVAPGSFDSRIMALLEATDGALWFGSELGIVWRVRDGEPQRVATVPQGSVRHLARWPDGRIAVADASDVFLVGSDGSRVPLSPTPLPDTTGIAALPGGDVMICGMRGIQRLRDGVLLGVDSRATAGLCVAPDGTTWFATDLGLSRWNGTRVERVVDPLPAELRDASMRAILATRSGAIWFGTRDSLCCLHPDGSRSLACFDAAVPVLALHEDSSGGIWVGTEGGGLVRLSVAAAEGVVLRSDQGRPLAATAVVADAPSSFLVGTARGLFRVVDGRADRQRAVPPRGVHSLLREADGTLWLGHDGELGCLRGEQYETFPVPRSDGPLRAIVRDRSGRLLIGSPNGVLEFAGGGFTPFAPAAALADSWVKLIVPWPDGSLWIVGERALLHVGPTGATAGLWQRGRDVPLAEVRAVFAGRGDRTWLATYGAGFVALDGDRVRVVGPHEGLPEAHLCAAIAFDGQVLVGGNRRPFLLDPGDLDRVADGERSSLVCRSLSCPKTITTEANGGCQPSSAVTSDTVALCGIGGLWLVPRGGLRRPTPALICHVRPELAGDQALADDGGGSTVRAQRQRTLVVHCLAPDFDEAASPSFCWRHAGGVWSSPSPGRAVTIVLPGPGTYRLEFAAIGHDRVPSPIVAGLAVRIDPLLTERVWFPWVGAFVAMVAGFLVFRFGSWRSARQATRLRQLVDVRTAELSLARDSLEQNVARRTEQLQQALEQLREDHAQRSRLERELEQMRRMESLGQLAGSVAHDFNNLLTVVLGNAQLIEGSASAAVPELAGRIVQAAQRGRDLTHRLLAVASQQTVRSAVLDLGELLRGEEAVLRDLLGSRARVVVTVADAPLFVRAAPGQIDQILMNLAVNAREVLPDGGTFSVAAARVGETVRMVVQDDGAGMPPEVAARVFEPFFTTRPERGTGLGLATVYGIVKQLRGDVAMVSTPGAGTTFTITLPVAPAPANGQSAEAAPVVLPRPESGTGGPRVLLVEDDADVRHALRLFLESCDCVVVAEADCGGEAVRRLAEYPLQIDVVVSDVRMPGVQGVDLVRALRGVRAGLPILFVSGHTASAGLATELARVGVELVGKPPIRSEVLPALLRAMRGATSSLGNDAGS